MAECTKSGLFFVFKDKSNMLLQCLYNISVNQLQQN